MNTPLIVLLYDRAFVSGSFRGAWRARWGYYLALAASWIPLALLAAVYGRNLDSRYEVGVIVINCVVLSVAGALLARAGRPAAAPRDPKRQE